MEEKFKQILALIHDQPDFKFEGELDWETLKKNIVSVEEFCKTVSENRIFQQKAFHALVEVLQNAYRYKIEDTPVNLYVKEKDQKLYILTENALSMEDLKNLKYLADVINDLSLEELKEIKIEQLTTGKVEPQFKKYNGMMSIRRRTGNKIHYHFERTADGQSKVSLIVAIDIE